MSKPNVHSKNAHFIHFWLIYDNFKITTETFLKLLFEIKSNNNNCLSDQTNTYSNLAINKAQII